MRIPFARLVELMVVRLFERCEQNGHKRLSVELVAVGLDVGADFGASTEDVWQACKELKRRGWIECSFETGPTCPANLSAEGRMRMEADLPTEADLEQRGRLSSVVHIRDSVIVAGTKNSLALALESPNSSVRIERESLLSSGEPERNGTERRRETNERAEATFAVAVSIKGRDFVTGSTHEILFPVPRLPTAVELATEIEQRRTDEKDWSISAETSEDQRIALNRSLRARSVQDAAKQRELAHVLWGDLEILNTGLVTAWNIALDGLRTTAVGVGVAFTNGRGLRTSSTERDMLHPGQRWNVEFEITLPQQSNGIEVSMQFDLVGQDLTPQLVTRQFLFTAEPVPPVFGRG